MTFASLFSGGGGADLAAKSAGFELAWGIEIDSQIAEVGNANLGGRIRCEDILAVDCRSFEKVDLLHASPPCPNFSLAKVGAKETTHDKALAQKVAEFIAVLKPRWFTLENVRKYKDSESFKIVLQTLQAEGYEVDYSVLNSADFAVPQTRQRLWLRASKADSLPKLPLKDAWVGWYAAIEDLLPSLPETRFANWQLKRLEAALAKGQKCVVPFWVGGANRSQSFLDFAIKNRPTIPGIRNADEPLPTVPADTVTNFGARAFIISDQSGSAGKGLQIRKYDEPVTTIRAKATGGASPRAWIEQGKVVAMTPRCLARFQSFPDSYRLPDKNSLACKIIGNAVPPLLYEKIAKGFLTCR